MQRPPVKMGIGTPAQRAALEKAGAEKVWMHYELEDVLAAGMRHVVFRSGDVVIIVQPNLLRLQDLKLLASEGVEFEVPGHKPRTCPTDESIQELLRLKPKGIKVDWAKRRSGRSIWPMLTKEELESLLEWWHTPGLKRRDVVARVREMVGAKVPDHWVRDQVIKATGSAARRPEQKADPS